MSGGESYLYVDLNCQTKSSVPLVTSLVAYRQDLYDQIKSVVRYKQKIYKFLRPTIKCYPKILFT